MAVTFTGGDIGTIITAGAALFTVIANFIIAIVQLLISRDSRNISRDNKKSLQENTELTKESAKKIDDVHAATDVFKASSGRIDVAALRAEHEQGVRDGIAAAAAARKANDPG